MSPIESIFPIIAGLVALAWASGLWPSDPEKRNNMEIRMPLIKSQGVMYSIGGLMLVFGIFAALGFVN